ncbi:MAG: ABC transporter ATP-binding protein [Anaerolineae bacterium]|nr:ABC transporter ATP-binding protein [Anaerolineae bacterium]MDQ7033897.1 ABC transporter ATP-binding protein [Anaerolineae bacterium]
MIEKAKKDHEAGSLTLELVAKIFPQRGDAGEVVAVDHVSLTIQRGEFVTLLGPSGCGKTTTLRLIAGFELPTSGKIFLDNMDITNQPPNKRDMALVFQSYALFPHMSVYDNVAYGLKIRNLSRAAIADGVEQVLRLVGLEGLGDRRPNQLSGGQQQRVALARCLVMEPRVLLFDEPLSNLDAKLRVQMRSEIHSLQRRLNVTSVYVTHDQIEAMALSDRIVVMNDGQIEQIGTPEDVYRRPTSSFVADFIGRANFLETHIDSANNGHVSVPILGQMVDVALNDAPSVGTRMTVLLRPEGLNLREDESLKQAKVLQAMYLGSEVEYIVEVDNQQLVVVNNDPRASRIFSAGQTVGIDVVHETVHLLPDGL